jgi:hypothetical protein
MSLPLLAGIVAGALSLLAYIPRAIRIIRFGSNSSTLWLIWTLSNMLVFLSYLTLNEKTTVWIPLAYFIGSGIMTVLSFSFSNDGWKLLFKWLLAISILSAARWLFASDAWVTLGFNLLIYLIVYIDIIKRMVKNKRKNTGICVSWGLFFLGALINIFAITEWTVLKSAYPLLLFVMNGIIFAISLKNQLGNPDSEQSEASA